jgi:hypothetical protein
LIYFLSVLFLSRNEINETYKDGQEGLAAPGKGLIVLYAKISRAFPESKKREGFFFGGLQVRWPKAHH